LFSDTHLEEMALLVPEKVPKAITRQWVHFLMSKLNFKSRNQETLPCTRMYAYVAQLDPGNEKKSLCFKWDPFEASVEVEI
jgi:hypothetical protein